MIETQLHEKLSSERTNVWIVIPLFTALITPGSVNGNLHWLFTHQTAEETMSFLQLVIVCDKMETWFNSILLIVSFWPISQQLQVKNYWKP